MNNTDTTTPIQKPPTQLVQDSDARLLYKPLEWPVEYLDWYLFLCSKEPPYSTEPNGQVRREWRDWCYCVIKCHANLQEMCDELANVERNRLVHQLFCYAMTRDNTESEYTQLKEELVKIYYDICSQEDECLDLENKTPTVGDPIPGRAAWVIKVSQLVVNNLGLQRKLKSSALLPVLSAGISAYDSFDHYRLQIFYEALKKCADQLTQKVIYLGAQARLQD